MTNHPPKPANASNTSTNYDGDQHSRPPHRGRYGRFFGPSTRTPAQRAASAAIDDPNESDRSCAAYVLWLAAPAPGSASLLVRPKEHDMLTIAIVGAVAAIAFLLGVFVFSSY